MSIIIDGVQLAPAKFYLEQMSQTIRMFEDGETANIGLPILSFFSGVVQKKPFAEIFTGHILIFYEDREMQRAVEMNSPMCIRWISVIFFYFREMAAFPDLADSIWKYCWAILSIFESKCSTMEARTQMACWAHTYDKDYAKIATTYIKKYGTDCRRE